MSMKLRKNMEEIKRFSQNNNLNLKVKAFCNLQGERVAGEVYLGMYNSAASYDKIPFYPSKKMEGFAGVTIKKSDIQLDTSTEPLYYLAFGYMREGYLERMKYKEGIKPVKTLRLKGFKIGKVPSIYFIHVGFKPEWDSSAVCELVEIDPKTLDSIDKVYTIRGFNKMLFKVDGKTCITHVWKEGTYNANPFEDRFIYPNGDITEVLSQLAPSPL